MNESSIDVWTCRLREANGALAEFAELLSQEERERAGRYRSSGVADQFVLRRAVLRVLAAGYLGMGAAQVRFVQDAYGKLHLGAGAGGLEFNVSESGGLAVYAFTQGCETGVDVEQERPMEEMTELAARFFCAEESAELMAMGEELRVRGFFACWVRKEAYVKALGLGLGVPLDEFRVTTDPDGPAEVLQAWNGHKERAWNLHDLAIEPGFAAAAAYPGGKRAVTIRTVDWASLL